MSDEIQKPKPVYLSLRTLLGYVLILLVSGALAFGVQIKSKEDYEAALKSYKILSQKEAEAAAKNVNEAFTQIYQGIRTISLLPSVRNIDRYGQSLDGNAHESITQIYRNMASNVAVSEVYIVPADLEPEQIDPFTGELQKPILMFDGSDEKPGAANEPKTKIINLDMALKADEVEIHEYRLLKEQLAYLKQHYPDQSRVDKLNLPFITGHEVLTCDNEEYKTSKKDADRTGIILSVPFFAPDGRLKGAISAIIRNNVIKDMLPDSDYALINEAYQYNVLSKNAGQQEQSLDYIRHNKADDRLLFSAVLPVPTTDPRSHWTLWAGYPDSRFTQSGDANAVQSFKNAGYGIAGLIGLLGCLVWTVIQRSAAMVRLKIAELEDDVSRRIAENQRMVAEQEAQKAAAEKQKREAMQEMAENFEFSVKGMVSQVASSATQMEKSVENVTHIAADTKERSVTVAQASDEAAQVAAQVAAAAEELTASIKEISAQTQKSSQIADDASGTAHKAQQAIQSLLEKSQKVSKIIGVITDIAEQINMLALNATIESARAGEAGKGFAVVASEVKNLATQVSKATDEITAQIGDMQGATTSSVESVMKIISIITQVTESTTAVAAAVEEQSAATNEIARNIERTTGGTRQISENILLVQNAAEETGVTSQRVLELAKNLGSQSDMLKKQVDEFLNTIRHS